MKYLIGAFITCLILGGAYVAYRYYEAAQVAKMLMQSDVTVIPDSLPIQCSMRASGFNSYIERGTLFIANEKMRADYLYAEGGSFSTELNAIVDDEWLYIWPLGSTKGTKESLYLPEVQDDDGLGFFDTALSCVPWWFPDKSVFILPGDVEFLTES